MLGAVEYRLGVQFKASVLPETKSPNPAPIASVGINLFHCIYGHAHEELLRHTARHLGIILEGDMRACTGCSMAKGYRTSFPRQTKGRAQTQLGKVFAELGGRKEVASVSEKHYTMIIEDNDSRKFWLYFLTRESDADLALNRFLVGVQQ